MITKYLGSGPYCFANSLAMTIGDGTDPGLVEVLTGSPFGLQLLAGRTPLFDPLGWDPDQGLDQAVELLGWTCERTSGGSEAEALDRLRAAVAAGTGALVGPVEMGLLLNQAGSGEPIGADHFVVVTGFDGDLVRFHDPHGHPFATMPAAAFAAAWRAETIGYCDEEYVLRSGFRRVRDVAPQEALAALLPRAVAWLDGRPDQAPPGSSGGAAAALGLAGLVDAGLDDGQRGALAWFAVRVGARRLADGARWLDEIGRRDAARIMWRQAEIVGGLQYPVVARDDAALAAGLRELAPTYEELRAALAG